jgi:hypothetical protein
MPKDDPLSCPAAPPHWPEAKIFGIAGGTIDHPEITFLDEAVPVTPELLAAATPVHPREVFRFSATCKQGGCPHWSDDEPGRCTLVSAILKEFDPVTDALPPCAIRKSCRWWAQEGRAACQRCAGIATDTGELPDDESAVPYLQDPRYFRPGKLRAR